MNARRLKRTINLWPPYLFSGVRVLAMADDWSYARVRLALRWYNRNYVGTHFGGSLFAMSDPFWMLLAINGLGRDYIVWDKAGAIDFIAAVKEDVFAEFRIPPEVYAEIRAATADGDKILRWFETEITTASGTLVAKVRKQLHIRRKSRPPG